MTNEEQTYTNRYLEIQTATRVTFEGEDTYVTGSAGGTCYCPKDVAFLLSIGSEYGVETNQSNSITGWQVAGVWYHRKSDQDMERERQEMLDGFAARRREMLEKHREQWQATEDSLPAWLKDRFAVFHENGGDSFRESGWGYELAIAELTLLYVESNCEDSDAVNEFAEKNGTSGNQHGFAKSMARSHLAAPETSLGGTVGALSPITGSAYYGKKE